MQFSDPPPMRYMGSKWQLADWIVGMFPPHVCYVEPYCGSAAVFFRKPPSKVETLNDLNGDLINFFDVLRTRRDELLDAIELTPHARAEYERSYQPTDDLLERARRFYVRSWQSFTSDTHDKGGWRKQKDFRRGSSITHDWKRTSGLYAAADRLRDAQIECRDALEVIRDFDTPRTLFYLDPPYPLRARKRASKRYWFEMTDADHRALADVLHGIKGMALLSGYACPLYEDLYGGWQRADKSTTTNGNSNAVESVWLSPKAVELALLPLWGGGKSRCCIKRLNGRKRE